MTPELKKRAKAFAARHGSTPSEFARLEEDYLREIRAAMAEARRKALEEAHEAILDGIHVGGADKYAEGRHDCREAAAHIICVLMEKSVPHRGG